MKFFLLSLAVIFTASFGNVYAQSKDDAKYREESVEMRKAVWSWDKAQFKVKEIPAEYAKASKVIIAHHTELTADSKSKFAFNGLGFGMKKEQAITEVVREMIKVNDKTAVDYYSELSFTQFEKSSGFTSFSRSTFVGVRIMKSNGSVKEINADDIVLTKDASKEKQAKLAVPDLQPGDILDYFIATEQKLSNDFSNQPYRIDLFDDAPILSLSFHAQLGKKYYVEYRSYNGAPELKASRNDDDDIVIDVEKTNIAPFETSLWVAGGQQLPFIRVNMQLVSRGSGLKAGSTSKTNTSDQGLTARIDELSTIYYNNYWMRAARRQYRDIEDDASKKAKQMGVDYKSLNDEDKAALLYYTFRFTKLMNMTSESMAKTINIGNYNFNSLGIHLYALLKTANINGAMLLCGSRTGIKLNNAMYTTDVNSITFMPGKNKMLELETVFDVPFTTPQFIEGIKETKKVVFVDRAISVSKEVTEGPSVPVSTSSDNAHIENLQISLTADKNNIAIKRSTTMKGLYKVDAQRQLVLYEDFYEYERKAFKDPMSLTESLEDNRKGKKYVDEVKNALAEAKKKQKDAFISEAKDWFEQDITEMKDYKTDSLGVRHTEPNFVYSSSFNLGGLLKKAGNNIIVEIGKIQGTPYVIKDDQRKRNIDVFMPFARSIEYNIELDIPDGYTAEGVAALNKKIENETGYFSAEATSTDKKVSLKIKKHYLHNFEPSTNFEKIIAFTDAANEWVGAKLLLKKK